MISQLYLIPTNNCNLHCRHCKQCQEKYEEDHQKFLAVAKKCKFEEGIIFGGEPLLANYDFVNSLCQLKNVKSISTNLLLLDECHLKTFRDNNLDVATSWNPTRFTKMQTSTWISNIKQVKQNGLRLTVLITITEDLLSSTDKVFDLLNQLESIGQMSIKFEPYVPSSYSLIEQADKWLVDISRKWKWPSLENDIFLRYATGNIFICKDIWSLYPDGTLQNSCPTGKDRVVLGECFHCQYANVCKPCNKQKVCSFFKRLYEYARLNGFY